MAELVSPYNFVPLYKDDKSEASKTSTTPDKKYTGVIEYTLYTRTHLFIPNTSRDPEKDEDQELHKTYDFFSYTDYSNKEDPNHLQESTMPVIPGSEVRGMFRSYFEILTNSCLSAVDENVVLDKESSMNLSAGLLKRKPEKNTFDLYESVYDYTKEHVFLISGTAEIGQRKVYKNKPIGYVAKVEQGKNGQHPSVYLFEEPEETAKAKREDISVQTLRRLLSRNKKQYNNYKTQFEKYIKGETTEEYFPVSYGITNNGDLVLSPDLPREPRKVKDLLSNHNTCTDKNKLCPACSLFGMVKTGQNGFSKASRVRFTDMECVESNAKKCYENEVTLPEFGLPQANKMNFYLKRPDENAVFWNSDYYIDKERGNEGGKNDRYSNECPINGRKFYWHNINNKNKEWEQQTKSSNNITIRPVKSGISFKGKLYFDNITKTELDQLIFLLNGGESGKDIRNKGHGYKLGKAKPYGYGSVAVSVTNVLIREFKQKDCAVERISRTYDLNKEYKEPVFNINIREQFNCITAFNSLAKSKSPDCKVSYVKAETDDEGFYKNYIEPMTPEIQDIESRHIE